MFVAQINEEFSICDGFSKIASDMCPQKEFAAALKHRKPGKAPGPHSIFPELITHAGAALKSWLCGFLSSCLLFKSSKFQTSGEEHW